jgi:hypothetical protein
LLHALKLILMISLSAIPGAHSKRHSQNEVKRIVSCSRRFRSVSWKLGLLGLLLFSLSPTSNAQPVFAWTRQAGGTNHDWASAISVDSAGNCYITGESQSPTISFGALTLTNQGNHAILAARYDNRGNLLWAKNAGQISPGSYPSRGRGVCADENGNAYVVGVFSGTISFGASSLTSTGFADMFVTKYDPVGAVTWVQRGGGLLAGDAAAGFRVAIGSSGHLYVAGQFSGNIQLSSAAGTNGVLSGEGVFLAKYDAAGNLIWLKQADGEIYPDALSADSSGNVFLAGDFTGPTATLGTNVLGNPGTDNGFLAKYDSQGVVFWVRQFGGSDSDWPVGVACDVHGNAFLSANILSLDAVVAGNAFTNGTHLLAKFDSAGNLEWMKGAPASADRAGRCVMASDFSGPLTIGSVTLTNSGDNFDVLVCQFDPGGNPIWAKQAGGIDLDTAWDVHVSSNGDIAVAGEFQNIGVFDSKRLTNSFPSGDIFVSRISGPPKLVIGESAGQTILNWPVAAGGFRLLKNSDLSTSNWESVTNAPVEAGTNLVLSLPAQGARMFFRLQNP